MGYRFVVVIFILSLFTGCAAFDHDNEPYTGFSQDEIVNAPFYRDSNEGPFSGYYSGSMVLNYNTCLSVSDDVGSSYPLVFEVVHNQSQGVVNVVFEDTMMLAGELKDDIAMLAYSTGVTNHFYHLDFAEEGKITGSYEIKESDENGNIKDACADYALSLEKGERPAEGAPTVDEQEVADEGTPEPAGVVVHAIQGK